jgi:hypothetical protein
MALKPFQHDFVGLDIFERTKFADRPAHHFAV